MGKLRRACGLLLFGFAPSACAASNQAPAARPAASSPPAPVEKRAPAPAAAVAAEPAEGDHAHAMALAIVGLRSQPGWLLPATACPADVPAVFESKTGYVRGMCEADLQGCFDRCRSGDANACYNSALQVESLKTDYKLAEALFLRACRLGSRSACTNRAAGILAREKDFPGQLACTTRTFELMCEHDDPWACTMFGNALFEGQATPRDLRRALQVLPKGCLRSERDDACVAARDLSKQIEAELEKSESKP